jgi:hypothetical protein
MGGCGEFCSHGYLEGIILDLLCGSYVRERHNTEGRTIQLSRRGALRFITIYNSSDKESALNDAVPSAISGLPPLSPEAS